MNRNPKNKTCNLPTGLRNHADEVEVLDADLQRRLLLEFRRGNDAALALAGTSCSPESRRSLEAQVRTGNRAKSRLICANMRLVIWVVSQSRRKSRWLDRDDLIQEGVRGLTRSIEKFDLDRGTCLSTYATWWIKQAIQRAAMNSGLVRIPVHVQDGTASGVAKTWARRFDEIMSIEGLSDDLLQIEAEFFAGCDSDEWQDAGLDVGPSENGIDDYIDAQASAAMAAVVLSHLDPREVFVMKCRYGMNGDPQTLEQIGEQLGITRERVRQIEGAALEKSRRLLEKNMVSASSDFVQ